MCSVARPSCPSPAWRSSCSTARWPRSSPAVSARCRRGSTSSATDFATPRSRPRWPTFSRERPSARARAIRRPAAGGRLSLLRRGAQPGADHAAVAELRSFLTKDLGIDWRWGERWFMRLLLDGDQASNNGNWQWIASVGVDPAPAFQRIFNPARQQERFDPGGAYVREYVPELAGVPDEHLAEPWTMPGDVQG